ncbi:MAG: acyl-CoA dehydrogenase family protein, partial [Gammaproteobacteria bacterium]|nr:acyl-CoA dehydrogenase family protein [Gammaproteobacteria bacterium]
KLKIRNIWEVISNEGIWSLPIAKQYGGAGIGWEESLIAMDGFLHQHFDIQLVALFISQISSLYFISRYGTEDIKNCYLPRLIRGEIATLHVAQQVHPLLFQHFNKRENAISNLRINKIKIFLQKDNKDINFYISETSLRKMVNLIDKSTKIILVDNNKDVGIDAVCDIVNFERLVYGLFCNRFINKIKLDA